MSIDQLVTSMSVLKVELKLLDNVNMDCYDQAYIYDIDMMICGTGNINHIKPEYEHFKSLVH